MIELGQEAKDKITGFKGILIGKSSWITGCDQYCLAPKAIKNEIFNGEWFDEGRIEITGKGILPKEIKNKVNGGPQRDAPKVH